jgi:hypothetical protein
MTEQQMANYTLTIDADSGYQSTTEGRCTAKQYGQAMAALHGVFPEPGKPWVQATTWRGLTDEDIRQCSKNVADQGPEDCVDRFAYAIEAKLREKNA